MQEVGSDCILHLHHAIFRHCMNDDQSLACIHIALRLVVFVRSTLRMPSFLHLMQRMDVALVEIDDDVIALLLQSKRLGVVPDEGTDADVAMLRCQGADELLVVPCVLELMHPSSEGEGADEGGVLLEQL